MPSLAIPLWLLLTPLAMPGDHCLGERLFRTQRSMRSTTFLVIAHCEDNHTAHADVHRFEKISNIIKQFKLSCRKCAQVTAKPLGASMSMVLVTTHVHHEHESHLPLSSSSSSSNTEAWPRRVLHQASIHFDTLVVLGSVRRHDSAQLQVHRFLQPLHDKHLRHGHHLTAGCEGPCERGRLCFLAHPGPFGHSHTSL